MAWKRIIAEKYDELKSKIDRRKTKGQSFSNNLKELEKIRSEGEKDLGVDEYYDLYKFNLSDIEKDVDEKISNEKYQKKWSWLMLILALIGSFILGIISTLIVQYFFR